MLFALIANYPLTLTARCPLVVQNRASLSVCPSGYLGKGDAWRSPVASLWQLPHSTNPTTFLPDKHRVGDDLFGVKSWWVIRETMHRLAVASPVRGASKLPPTPPWSGRFYSPLNPIDHVPAALKGVPAPWNPDHFMETKRAFAPLWKPTTNAMRIGCAPWYSPMEARNEH